MLEKRIDIGSFAFGLADAGEDLTKGDAVVVRADGKAYRPTTQAEADSVKGFAYLVPDQWEGPIKDYETIVTGKKVMIYTLVRNNRWATTQFIGTPAIATDLVVGFVTNTDSGKLRALTADEITASRAPQFRVTRAKYAKGDFNMIDVDVLR